MAANYRSVQAQLRAAGLAGRRVDALEVTARVVRTEVDGERERRGWYLLREVRSNSGQDILIGSFGVWHGTDNGAQRIALDESDDLTKEQLAELREKWKADRRAADAQRKAEGAAAARRAEAVWRRCSEQPPEGGAGYLIAKGVAGHGVRYSESGAVYVPMLDAGGRLHGLQAILSKSSQAHARRIARTGRDKEYWPAGVIKEGRWHQIGVVIGLVLLCEGYATGASLHEATGLPVAIAFDAGNLTHVAKQLAKKHPRARILICADDDFASDGNPGVSAASTAALAVNGAWVAPAFHVDDQIRARERVAGEVDWAGDKAVARATAKGILADAGRKLTDFNDLHAAEGLVTVRAQIESRLAELGWRTEHTRAGTQTGGGGSARSGDDWRFDLDVLLADYALIYSTDTVFDRRRRLILGLGPLRSAAGKGLVRAWLEHPDRTTVLPDQVGFDPAAEDPRIECNLWSGWPTSPQRGSCELLLELLEFLCSGEASGREVYEWILKWLAYPIQHPGAKMQTALLIHGDEGTGKNTFFGCVRKIYGRYGVQFSQAELEDRFNDWSSAKLFAIGNEVVTRAEMYHLQGRIKTLITEPETIINPKGLPKRIEGNHCNLVFFSNRVDIAKLDDKDRRFLVVWTPPPLPEAFFKEVGAEIAAGGVEALHDYLLSIDLTGFGPHSKPPMTRAKEELIELSMDSTERFFRVWTSGALAEHFLRACLSSDLYELYRVWCSREGIGKPAQRQTLLTVVGKKVGVRKSDERWRCGHNEGRGTIVVPPGVEQAPGRSRQDWLGDQIEGFRGALGDFREQRLSVAA